MNFQIQQSTCRILLVSFKFASNDCYSCFVIIFVVKIKYLLYLLLFLLSRCSSQKTLKP